MANNNSRTAGATGGPVLIGDSLLGRPSELGIEGPAGADTPVLHVSGLSDREWLSVKIPNQAGKVTNYTAVWDVRIEQSTGGLQSLFQTSAYNTDDAELFVDANGGVGANGQFHGSVQFGKWARIAVTLSDNGNGTSTMAKYVNGELVGEQTVETARYTLTADQNVLLLSDNDGDTGAATLSHFGIMPRTMTPQELKTLGTVSAEGPFTVPPIPADAPAPVRLTTGGLNQVGGIFAEEALQTNGLTFETEFAFRFARNGDGMTFQLQSEREGYSLISDRDGGELGLHEGTSPTIAIVFDTSKNPWDAAGNQIRVIAGGDAHSVPLASVTAPFPLAGAGLENKAWIEYDGTTLKVYASATDVKPATPLISLQIDLTDYLQDTARVGLVATTGAGNPLHEVVDWTFESNDPAGPSGALLVPGVGNLELLGDAERLAPGDYQPGGAMQIGFDEEGPKVEGNFSQADLIDEPTTHRGIADQLVTPKDAPMAFDLSEVFGSGAHDFAVTNSNGDAVEASIVNGVLTVSFGAYGLADLHITAKGPLGQDLTDDVRIRVAGEGAYTIAILPDTQHYSDATNPLIRGIPADMAQWIADNAGNKNISFVSHVGDVSDTATTAEFAVMRDAMDILREAGIPFSLLPGNHDIGPGGNASDRDSSAYNAAFSVEYMSEDPTFGGVYDLEQDRYDNNYHLWTAPDGTDWIVLNLEFGPRDDVLRWADDVLTEHGDRKAMVVTHSYNNFNGRHDPLGSPLENEGAGYNYGIGNDPQGAWDGEQVWRDVISKHPNVVFTAGGHVFGDGAQTVVSYNDFGNPVFQFTVNYQGGVDNEVNGGYSQGGNGAIRLVTVDPVNGAFYTETYFTEYDDYYTGVRGSEEESRDGLTGDHKGHQEEYFDLDLGEREAQAIADAGTDQVVETAGDTAKVELSAGETTDSNDEIASWVWTDSDGNVVATGKDVLVDLGGGVHDLTLTVTTSKGVVSSDDTRVIVKSDTVLLVDTFNDGKADGWVLAGAANPMAKYHFGTTASFGVPAIGGQVVDVVRIDKLGTGEGLHVKPDVDGRITEYTLAFDLYLPSGQTTYTSLLQTAVGNTTDAELFLRNLNNGTAGLGTAGNYPAAIALDSWNRIVVTMSVEGTAHVMRRYVNGEMVGGPLVVDADVNDGSRWSLDGDRGFLLFADESNETTQVYASAVAFVPDNLSDAAVRAMGGVDADGPLSAGNLPDGAFQLNLDGSIETGNLGTVEATLANLANVNQVFVKGSATIDNPAVIDAQGALFDRSGAANSTLVREGGDFDDMIVEVTMRSMDKNSIGVAFNRSADGDQYLVVFNNVTNTRQLVRIENGTTTVLASEAGGYTFNDAQDLFISKVGGRITVTLDGIVLFGGAVTDQNPLHGGTIALYSSGQAASIFDDVVVRTAETTAHAGNDRLVIDWDNNGSETVALDGTSSVLTGSAGTDAQWTGKGVEADGLEVNANVQAGRNIIELDVGGSTDEVVLDLASGDRLIAADRFEDGNHAGWTILDKTELGGGAKWQVIGGKLVETSGAYSRELTYGGTNVTDVWQKGWSPLGDGTYALHKGSYALWEGRSDLSDYAIQAKVQASGGAVGFMLNYVDENNYYKLELDSRAGTGMYSLVKVVNNYETVLARSAATFTKDQAFALEARIVDGKITATVDGHDIFAYPIEIHDLGKGSAGVWSWGSAGAAFDDIAIVDLTTPFGPTIRGTLGDDELSGTLGNDNIAALEGDDMVRAGAGDDIVDGGEGDDELFGGAGNDTVEGGEGDDEVYGNEGDDVLTGGDGDDVIYGGEGNDILSGGRGNDKLYGEAGNDILKGSADDDLLDGGAGTDTADFSDDAAGVTVDLSKGEARGADSGIDQLVSIEIALGGSGNDVFTGNSENNSFVGGAGSDTLMLAGATGAMALDFATGTVSGTGMGTDRFSGIEVFRLDAGSATLILSGDASTVTIDGGAGTDTLLLRGNGQLGTLANVEKLSLEGNWTLNDEDVDIAFAQGAQTLTLSSPLITDGSYAGTISGFAQQDRIEIAGFVGVKAVLGKGNAVTISDAAGEKVMLQLDPSQSFAGMAFSVTANGTGGVYLTYAPGNGGDDVMTGGNGDDVFDGGAGDDLLKGGAGDDTLLGGDGDDELDAGSGDDTVEGGSGRDVITLGSGDDVAKGGDGDDLIDAGSGDDIIDAGAGNDSIDGGSGNDLIVGGAGDDIMAAGSGNDIFIFAAGFGHDVVIDFRSAGSSADMLDFGTLFDDFDDVMGHAQQVGENVVITLDDDNSLTLNRLQLSSLSADDFRFN